MFKFLKFLRGSIFLQISAWICMLALIIGFCIFVLVIVGIMHNVAYLEVPWFLNLAKYTAHFLLIASFVAILSIFEFIIRKFVLLKPIVAEPEPTEKLPKILDRIYSLFFFFITVLNFLAFILCLILLNVFMEIFIY